MKYSQTRKAAKKFAATRSELGALKKKLDAVDRDVTKLKKLVPKP